MDFAALGDALDFVTDAARLLAFRANLFGFADRDEIE